MTEQNGNRNGLSMSTNFLTDFDTSDWISQSEAARVRGVSRQAIARLVRKGRFQTLRLGGRTLVRASEVRDFKAEPPGRPSSDEKD
jgi:excisionase family DNA binding protein